MSLGKIFGGCVYNWYGAGGHQSLGAPPYTFAVSGTDLINSAGNWVSTIRALPKFKLHRAFVDNWIVVPETESNKQTFTLKTNPTEQNFFFDDFFKLQKANGIKTIWSASGCFDWYKTALGGKSQRKSACYNPAISPNDAMAWADLARLCSLITERYRESQLIDYLQILNEWDFRWNVPHVLTPEEYAVGLYESYKAIRSVSATQKIMTGCTLTPKLETAQRLFAALDKLTDAAGQPKIRDVVFTFNLYIRTESTNQGEGIGATPEEVNIYGTFFKPLNDWCKAEGLKFACTESGYNSSPSTSTAAMKNKAPMLEGYTLEEAQGILAIRTALIIGSCSECVGITFYHCKDGYEAEPFTYHGFNYDKDFGGKPDWSAKPARTICEDFLEKYGEYRVQQYNGWEDGMNEVHFARLINDETQEVKFLDWTDKKNIGEHTPMPKYTEITTNPFPMLTIQNTKLYKDGQPFFIKELNSPETLLRQTFADFKAIVDYAASVGLNTIYCTLYAGDKYKGTLHPYNGSKVVNGASFGNPASGFAEARLLDWKEKLEYAASKGFVLHLLTSEKENHFIHTDAEWEAFVDKMIAMFGHLPIIWDAEEVPLGHDAWINTHFGYLKSKGNGIVAIHNNTGEKPWVGHSDVIQFLSIQADISSFDSIIKTETANGFAAYSSEMTGGFQTGDTAKAQRIRDAGGDKTSGAGIYIPSLDQDATLAQLKSYDSVFKTLSGNTIPPNPPTMRTAFITTNKTAPYGGVELLGGMNLTTGSYAIYVDGASGVDLELFKDGVSFIAKRRENAIPLAVGGDDNGTLRLKDFTDGAYRLTISGQPDINFTVGSVTPPPQNEPVTETYVESGTHVVFKTAGGTYKAPVSKV